jgi:hypothetical protein
VDLFCSCDLYTAFKETKNFIAFLRKNIGSPYAPCDSKEEGGMEGGSELRNRRRDKEQTPQQRERQRDREIIKKTERKTDRR